MGQGVQQPEGDHRADRTPVTQPGRGGDDLERFSPEAHQRGGVVHREGDQGDPERLDQRERFPPAGRQHPPGDRVQGVHHRPERQQHRDHPGR